MSNVSFDFGWNVVGGMYLCEAAAPSNATHLLLQSPSKKPQLQDPPQKSPAASVPSFRFP
jgi:hypothetical protein